MNAKDIMEHKVNPKCDCTMCFVKDVMDKADCNYEVVIDYLMELQSKGLIEINDYDKEGHPIKFKRLVSEKEMRAFGSTI